MMKYRYGSHTVYKIEYHFVWVTKYKDHVLTGDVALRVRELVRQTFDIKILRGIVSKDHVYIHVSSPPNIAPCEIMKRIKGRTARKLFAEYPNLKNRYRDQHIWASGYFCVTSNEFTNEMIGSYLAHHFTPNTNDNFHIEG